MKGSPSEGIYYVVRYPAGWELVVQHFKDGKDTNHYDWWETSLAVKVAAKWAKHLRVDATVLENEISLLTYAFPRGRISKVGSRFLVFQSGNITPAMGIPEQAVEEAFGIKGRSTWQYDEHEQCIEEDKKEIRCLLLLREDWRAT